MNERLQTTGWVLGGFFFIAVLVGIPLAFLYGLVWITSKLYPIIQALASLGTVLLIFMLLPSAIFRRSRNFCGNGIVLVSYVWGLSLWMWALLLLYELWGLGGLFLGFILLPGAVPLVCIALLFTSEFSAVGLIILSVITIFAVRALGHWIVSKGVPKAVAYYDY
jgi:hypothetical protein